MPRSIVLFVLLGAVFGCGAPDSGTATGDKPNIILIYADDLGWRDLGVMGSVFYETPNIDRLASEGIRFTNAYSNAPNCAPSRASLLTGLYAPRHGVYTVGRATRGLSRERKLIPVENRTELALEFTTVAEILREAGYATGQAGKWHLGGDGLSADDQGFDWSVAGSAAGAPPSYFYPYTRNERAIPELGTGGDEGEYLTDRLTEEAIGFLEANADRPFFLYLSHYAVHTPIQAKEELIERYRSKEPSGGHNNPTYAAMIESLDESVGRIVATVDGLGLSERTIILFYSDNGGHGAVTSMEPLRGSKGMLYEGGIREPLIARWPGRAEPGSVSDALVIGTDLLPTFIEIAGIALPADTQLDGKSIVQELSGGNGPDDRTLFWHFPAYLEANRNMVGPWRTTPASALRRGRYKLIHFFEDGRTELFDLEEDIGEQNDLSRDLPELTTELFNALEDWWEETDAFIPVELNPEYAPEAHY